MSNVIKLFCHLKRRSYLDLCSFYYVTVTVTKWSNYHFL